MFFITQEWSKMRTSEKKPAARSGHATCVINGTIAGQDPLLMVVGGVGASTEIVFADVWFLNVTDGSWIEVIGGKEVVM